MKLKIVLLMVLTLTLLLTACADKSGDDANSMEDFSFSLTWGCNGDSTYDSKTGKLVKQKIATNIDDYTTTYFFTDEQMKQVYDLIADMKPESYPDEYNPIKGETTPTRNIVLTVTYNGVTKTITCNDISLDNAPNGKKGEKFMAVHDAIVNIVTSSSEWASLPEYEFLYD